MKRFLAMLVSVMLFVSLFAVATAEETKYDLGGATVKVRLWASPNPYAEDVSDVDKEKWLPIFEAAREKYNVNFEFYTATVEYDDMPDEFIKSVAAGQPVWHITNNLSAMWLMYLTSNNTLADIKAPVSKLPIPELFKNTVVAGEGVYGFITEFQGTEGLVFNKGMIEDAGMEYTPSEMFQMGKWSYDDCYAYLTELQSKLPDGDYAFFIDPYYWSIFAPAANGTAFCTSDYDVQVGSDAFIECIEFLQKLKNAGVIRPVNTTESGGSDYWGTPGATFDKGVEVAMTHRALWQVGGLNDNGVDWGFVPYPWGSNVTLGTEGDYTSLSSNFQAAYYDYGFTGAVLAGFENDFPGMDRDYVLDALVNLSFDLFVSEEAQARLVEWAETEAAGGTVALEPNMGLFNDELSAELYNFLRTRTAFNPISALTAVGCLYSSPASEEGNQIHPGVMIRNIVNKDLSVRSTLEAAVGEIEAGLVDAGLK